jgi:hypothetical protein
VLVTPVLAIAGCALIPDPAGPRHWDVDTGEVDCSLGGPVGVSLATASLAALAGYGAYKVHHPDVQQRDQYGYPSNVALGPDFYRGVEYFAGGIALVTAAVSVIEWVQYSRCSATADLVHGLVTARDCTTVVQLDAELGRRDPYMQRAVRASEASVTACLNEAR